MQRRIPTTLFCLLLLGCAGDLHRPDTEHGLLGYLSNDTPDNVIANLEAAYANRDYEAYAALFAPEFVFRFQPKDAERTGVASWGLEEELQSAKGLFTSPQIRSIEIQLTRQPAAVVEAEGLEYTVLVRVSHTVLRVTEAGGNVLTVNGDRQEFFLRREIQNGRDRWLIVEWRDLPGRG